jgi:hypothetical protein
MLGAEVKAGRCQIVSGDYFHDVPQGVPEPSTSGATGRYRRSISPSLEQMVSGRRPSGMTSATSFSPTIWLRQISLSGVQHDVDGSSEVAGTVVQHEVDGELVRG